MSILRKNIIFNTLLSFSQIIFPLVTFPYAARILEPAGVGQVSYVDSLTQYFILFAAVGIPLYGVREMSKIKRDRFASSVLFSEMVSLHVIMTLFFLFVYVTLIFVVGTRGLDYRLYLIGGGIIISNVFIIEWYYQSQERFSFITKRTILLRFVFIFLMFFLVKTKDDVVIYYFLFLILQLFNGIINFSLVFKDGIEIRLKKLNLFQHIKPLLFLTTCSVIGSVYVLLDNVILGILSNNISVGYYSAAVKITKVPISLITSLGIVLVPKLSESFSNNDLDTIKYYIQSSIHYVLTLGIPLGIGIALTAKWTVIIVSGNKFESAVQLVQILSPIVPLIALNCIYFFQLFTPGNKERTMILILLVTAIISVVSNVFLIPFFAHLGAAITTTITELCVFLISVYFAKKIFSVNFKVKLLFNPIISSMPFFPIIFAINELEISNILKLILGGSLCFILYFSIQLLAFKDAIVIKLKNYILAIFK